MAVRNVKFFEQSSLLKLIIPLLGDHELFKTSSAQNPVEVSLVRPLTEADILDRTYLMTVLQAHRADVEPAATVLLVNIPVTTPRPDIVAPSFTKPLYRGYIDNEAGVLVEDIVLVASTYSSAVTFELSGDDSEFFELTSEINVVQIGLRESVTEDQLASREFLTFEVVARHPEANLARAGVLISVPAKECPG